MEERRRAKSKIVGSTPISRSKQVGIRLEPELLARIDARVERAERRGMVISRAEMIGTLVRLGLRWDCEDGFNKANKLPTGGEDD